jgi:hypothetical protein
MKKLMTAMLGLSMLVGTTAVFAADKDTTKSTAKSTTKAKKGKKKSTTTPAVAKPAAPKN